MASPSGAGSSAVRIGIETGPAVVGPIGGWTKVEYVAVGEVVGVAASLQSVASAGSVLVGPATRAATEGVFEWGPTEKVALNAHTRPLMASYLERPKARGARRHGHLGVQAHLAGRQVELAVLDSALREAVQGHGSVVVLVGDAGLGKTRLVQECRKRFVAWVGAGSGRLPLWLEGRCASYASSTPYGLYQQLLAAWVGVAPDQGEAVVRPALERALMVLMGNKDLWPLLARMMGLPGGAGLVRLGPEELQRATFSAIGSLVSRLVAVGPTVLALEDLHWADPTSLRLSTELAAVAQDRPLLVLATRRPDPDPEASSFERSLAARPVPLHRVELSLGLLTAVCETEGAVTGETLDAAIAELSSTGLLQEVTGLPEPTYRFRHALIQEATYL
jgi:hypothetical protein